MKRGKDTAYRGSDIDEDRGSDITDTDEYKELKDESLKSSKQKETA